ncbi:MAG TPA: hypothetical protein VKP00_04320, partial [Gemmatimonadaceae bacterium]|nr:hypothetical protein [Gemmatimonadaceae bacterium]
DRYDSAREFAEALAGRGTTAAASSEIHAPVQPRVSKSRAWPAATAALALVAATASWMAVRERRAARSAVSDAPVVRVSFDLPAEQRIVVALPGATVAVSPKGDVIAYATLGPGGIRTFIRQTNELVSRALLDVNNATVAGRNLAFSPDGRWLAFTEGNVLKKASVDGGQVVNVKSLTIAVPYGVTWLGNDTIVVGSYTGLEAVPAHGGGSTMIGLEDSASARVGQRWPLAVPGGRYIAFVAGNTSFDQPRLAVLDVHTKAVVTHDLPTAFPLGFLAGQFVYVSTNGVIMAVPFDFAGRRPAGEPVPLEEGVVVDPTGGAKAALSASGTLMYLHGRAEEQPILFDPASGASTPLFAELHVYSTPRFSPDGKRVAITVVNPRSSDIWIYDIQRNTFTRLTAEGSNERPEWTPDGKRVLFRSERTGKPAIWWQPADGSGPAELLYAPPYEPFEAIVSPDSKWLVFRTAPGSVYPRDILAVPLDGDRKIVPLVVGPASDQMPRLSPDGKWLAYQSNEATRFEVYVRPFPGSGARVQVSAEGGTEPMWNRQGTALYYRDPLGQIIEVKVTTGASFSIGQRRVVVTGDYLTESSHANYDVSPDGRLLLLKRAGAGSQTIVVHNWGRELREMTAGRK